MPFQFTDLELPGVILIEPRVYADERGFFMETYKQREFIAAGITESFVQENHSRSTRHTVRGMHFQRPPYAQAKLVRVVAGEICDVALDVRPQSRTFGRWVSVTLSAENRRMVYIPSWCAHGFCVTSAEAEVMYKTSSEYAVDHEVGVRWDDPDVGITWPVTDPILSAKDRTLPSLRALAPSLVEAAPR
jgi:dTDP-4-dehydrorhamnose 3,5-epimerase